MLPRLARTNPSGLTVEVRGGEVCIGGCFAIPMEEFLFAATHVLLATNLDPDDPRLKFVELIRSMSVRGQGGKTRLKVREVALSSPLNGEEIEVFSRRMALWARAMGVPVKSVFNGIAFVAKPGDDICDIVARYNAASRRLFPRKSPPRYHSGWQ